MDYDGDDENVRHRIDDVVLTMLMTRMMLRIMVVMIMIRVMEMMMVMLLIHIMKWMPVLTQIVMKKRVMILLMMMVVMLVAVMATVSLNKCTHRGGRRVNEELSVSSKGPTGIPHTRFGFHRVFPPEWSPIGRAYSLSPPLGGGEPPPLSPP